VKARRRRALKSLLLRALAPPALLLLGLAALPAEAQVPPQAQCVTAALAGGTGDQITVPLLPCQGTTTLLVLTLTSVNATTTPTLRMLNAPLPALPIVNYDGSALNIGQLTSGAIVSLTGTGTQWRLLNESTVTAAQLNGSLACRDPVAYGADPLGISDSLPALIAAVTVLPANGGCIQFSPGTFKFNSTFTFNYPVGQAYSGYSLGIYGSGITASRLLWPASNGIVATTNEYYQSFHLRDLSVETGTPGTYTALTLTTTINEGNGLSDVLNVGFGTTTAGTSSAFCGGGAGACNYWAVDGNIAQSNVQFARDFFYGDLGNGHGIGLHFQGIGGPFKYSLNHHISNSYFWGLQYGVVYDSYTQGIEISNTYFGFGCYQGIYSPSTADPGPAGLEELLMSNDDVECSNASVVLQGPVFEVQIVNSQLDNGSGASAILFGNTSFSNTITGNWITGASTDNTNGIYAGGNGATLTNSTITGNVFTSEAVAIAFNQSDVNNTISGNTYNNVTAILNDVSANNTRSGERNLNGLIAIGNSAEINPTTGDYNTGAAGGGYYVNSVPGVSCSAGIDASTYRSINGIVTHC
jgi:hypothetical protein